jgi:hypothetical protein
MALCAAGSAWPQPRKRGTCLAGLWLKSTESCKCLQCLSCSTWHACSTTAFLRHWINCNTAVAGSNRLLLKLPTCPALPASCASLTCLLHILLPLPPCTDMLFFVSTRNITPVWQVPQELNRTSTVQVSSPHQCKTVCWAFQIWHIETHGRWFPCLCC